MLGVKYAATFGCMSMPFGCMSMDRLGACMRLLGASLRLLGASLRRRLGACMRLLGASFIRLKPCLTVGSYCRHAYPTSWAQGPPGAPGPVTKPSACNKV